jgi:hypothetical protein
MRTRVFWLGAAGIAAFAFVAGSDAQPPGKKGFGKKGNPFGPAITVEQIVERIMAHDRNNDGKITMDELPERMQHLIAMGDTNKDGALDKEEVQKLASTLESFLGIAGPGDGPKGGPGKGPPGKGGPGGPLMRTLDDLNLTGTTRDKASSLIRAHQDKVRRLEEMARTELLVRMKDVLNEEDFKAFKAEADNLPPPKGFGPPPGKGFGPPKGPPPRQ